MNAPAPEDETNAVQQAPLDPELAADQPTNDPQKMSASWLDQALEAIALTPEEDFLAEFRRPIRADVTASLLMLRPELHDDDLVDNLPPETEHALENDRLPISQPGNQPDDLLLDETDLSQDLIFQVNDEMPDIAASDADAIDRPFAPPARQIWRPFLYRTLERWPELDNFNHGYLDNEGKLLSLIKPHQARMFGPWIVRMVARGIRTRSGIYARLSGKMWPIPFSGGTQAALAAELESLLECGALKSCEKKGVEIYFRPNEALDTENKEQRYMRLRAALLNTMPTGEWVQATALLNYCGEASYQELDWALMRMKKAGDVEFDPFGATDRTWNRCVRKVAITPFEDGLQRAALRAEKISLGRQAYLVDALLRCVAHNGSVERETLHANFSHFPCGAHREWRGMLALYDEGTILDRKFVRGQCHTVPASAGRLYLLQNPDRPRFANAEAPAIDLHKALTLAEKQLIAQMFDFARRIAKSAGRSATFFSFGPHGQIEVDVGWYPRNRHIQSPDGKIMASDLTRIYHLSGTPAFAKLIETTKKPRDRVAIWISRTHAHLIRPGLWRSPVRPERELQLGGFSPIFLEPINSKRREAAQAYLESAYRPTSVTRPRK